MRALHAWGSDVERKRVDGRTRGAGRRRLDRRTHGHRTPERGPYHGASRRTSIRVRAEMRALSEKPRRGRHRRLPALRQRQSTICFKKHRVIARNNLLQSAQAGKAFFRRNILIDVSDQLLCIGKPFRKWHLAQPHDVKHREQRIFNELTCQPPSPVFQCRWHVSFHRPTLPVPFSATSFFLMNRKLSYCFFHPTI